MNKKLSRLAVIAPLPPAQTGIAYYTQELLNYLSVYYDITTISTQEEAEVFKINYSIYDRIILHIGNSAFHTYMLDILESIPVVVVLHDFYLNNLFDKSKKLSKKTIYKEQGYQAIVTNSFDYPFNKTILNESLGTITHSHYSKELASKFYNNPNFTNWDVIPHLKKITTKTTIKNLDIKSKLNLPEDSFIVASFGLLSLTKKNQELIDGWLNSTLSKDENCYLIFVGDAKDSPYSKELLNTIENSKFKNRIIITGWVDEELFNDYLNITDIAVQLRTLSRGETSGTVLDTLSYGIPTIINANGSLKELPNDIVYMLEDDFSISSLVESLEDLFSNSTKRETLIENARKYLKINNDPKYCASKYYETIEKAYKAENNYKKQQIEKLNNYPLVEQIKTIQLSNFDKISQKQILVDISAIYKNDLKTGIQNVVKSQLKELIINAPKNYRIEPIYLVDDIYFYAKDYTLKLFDISSNLKDEPIRVNKGDIFYGLDLCLNYVQKAHSLNIYTRYKALGVKFVFLVYDLLPVTHPEFFPAHISPTFQAWLKVVTKVADQFITISNDVAKNLQNYTSKPITPIHIATKQEENLNLNSKNTKYMFLIVGTIEPRKGHNQLLEAFNILWEKNIDISLTIVGKVGWDMDSFIKKVTDHSRLNKNLFFKEFISDEELKSLYQTSTALIAPSQAEGFGLPLIEAASYNLPIIARDIDVFKEVSTNYAYYFKNTLSWEDLATNILDWIELYKTNNYPKSNDMPFLIWEENANKTLLLFKAL